MNGDVFRPSHFRAVVRYGDLLDFCVYVYHKGKLPYELFVISEPRDWYGTPLFLVFACFPDHLRD